MGIPWEFFGNSKSLGIKKPRNSFKCKDFDQNYLQELDEHGILKVNQWHGMTYFCIVLERNIDVCQEMTGW